MTCDKKCKKTCDQKKCQPYMITNHQITGASKCSVNGYVIDKPGSYMLCNDIDWSPRSSNSFAITIEANDVSLDLGNHVITQTDTSTSLNFAIHVLQNSECVSIRNGKFSMLSGGAVLVEAGSSCITIENIEVCKSSYQGQVTVATPINQSPPFPTDITEWAAPIFFNGQDSNIIKDVTLKNLNLCDNGMLGEQPIHFMATIVNNVLTLEKAPLYEITNGFILSSTSAKVGTRIISQIDATHYNVTATNNVLTSEPMSVVDQNGQFTATGSVSAIHIQYTDNLVLKDIIVNELFGDYNNFGINILYCNNVHGANWFIQDLQSFGLIKGYYPFVVTNCIFEDIVVNRLISNVNGTPATPFFRNGAEGCKVDGFVNGIIRRNKFNNSIVQTQVPITSPTILLDSVGIIVASVPFEVPAVSKDILFEDCFSAGHTSDGGGDIAQISGGFASISAGYIFINVVFTLAQTQFCELRNSMATNISNSLGVSFGTCYLGECTNMLCNNNTFQNITSDILAAGIADASLKTNMYKNQIDAIIGPAFDPAVGQFGGNGIFLFFPNGDVISSDSIINKNRISNCSNAAILNLSGQVNHLVTGNYASYSGPTGALPNYVGLNPNVPIVRWDYLSMPAPRDVTILDNLDLRKQ